MNYLVEFGPNLLHTQLRGFFSGRSADNVMLANHKVLTKIDLEERHCKVLRKVTCSRLWLKSHPNVKLSRLLGRVKPSILWLSPNFKL